MMTYRAPRVFASPRRLVEVGAVDTSTVKGAYVVVGFALLMAALSVVLVHAK